MCVLVYLCSTMNGYDGSLMGSINSLPTYLEYFNLPQNGAASTGIIFSIFQIGQMVGALFIWLADWRGRRLSIFIGCTGVVVGKRAISLKIIYLLTDCRNDCYKHSQRYPDVCRRTFPAILLLNSCFYRGTSLPD